MVKAQKLLDENYPKEGRDKIIVLDFSELHKNPFIFSEKRLEGHLDLSDFTELTKLLCPNNLLTSLNLKKCSNLQEINCANNSINADLDIFSHLFNLKRLDLETPQELKVRKTNNFFGSLKSFENCRNLEHLCIANQGNIKGGLEYLPTERLKVFVCTGTEFEKQLEPYGFKISVWVPIWVEKRKLIDETESSTSDWKTEIKVAKWTSGTIAIIGVFATVAIGIGYQTLSSIAIISTTVATAEAVATATTLGVEAKVVPVSRATTRLTAKACFVVGLWPTLKLLAVIAIIGACTYGFWELNKWYHRNDLEVKELAGKNWKRVETGVEEFSETLSQVAPLKKEAVKKLTRWTIYVLLILIALSILIFCFKLVRWLFRFFRRQIFGKKFSPVTNSR